jgi:hypothetical protein
MKKLAQAKLHSLLTLHAHQKISHSLGTTRATMRVAKTIRDEMGGMLQPGGLRLGLMKLRLA